MNINFFTNCIISDEGYEAIKRAVESSALPIELYPLSTTTKALYITALSKMKRTLVVVPEDSVAVRLCDDINTLAGGNIAAFFPARDLQYNKNYAASLDGEATRLSALAKLFLGETKVLVTTVESAVIPVPRKVDIEQSVFNIKEGDILPLTALTERLVNAGYQRRSLVDGICQFSVRGGIVDFYSPISDMPIRAEYWGDEIDTISLFELGSQRRVERIKSTDILPAREFAVNANDLSEVIKSLLKGCRNEALKATLNEDLEAIDLEIERVPIDRYLPLLGITESIFDYFDDGSIVFCDYEDSLLRAKSIDKNSKEEIKNLLLDGVISKKVTDPLYDQTDLEKAASKAILLNSFLRQNSLKLKELIKVDTSGDGNTSPDIEELADELRFGSECGSVCAIFAGTAKSAKIVASDLSQRGITATIAEEGTFPRSGGVYLFSGNVASNCHIKGELSIISFKKSERQQKRRRNFKKGDAIRSLEDVAIGDNIVHITHGIGVYRGIHKITRNEITKDYIKIAYRGSDVLYIPVTQLDMVSKYIGSEDVKLSKLGTAAWQNAKARVRVAAKQLAFDLLELYAKRRESKGFAYFEDGEMQRDFEGRFPYEETEDQLRCTAEIKKDMQSDFPMERLLCGDVGFGKTEVALRAIFKAVDAGKQVAVLAPTTILALQHYNTMKSRFEGFPIDIELISRHRSKKEQNDILKRCEQKRVDVLIGTHRVLGKDVRFADLGLCVIDEEQRFGVAHKERFKELKNSVDILTLTATPIPRTLNMALNGIRDMSILENPPLDRQPVQTYVVEYDVGIIKEAISKELRRGGQVFYLSNNTETIEQKALILREMFPNATIETAHGKMDKEKISDIWQRMTEGECDILVCTTIIETGVDIPNANTLVVENADRFGLSQLYQLRGRIGRSSRRAFAYFTFRPDRVVSEIATKRLNAIREFTKFGSGFKIALRDLEIRGAGSLLGATQSGHIEQVGYDVYLKLLNEAVEELSGVPKKVKAEDCLIDIKMEAHIPEDYIEEEEIRIDIYRKVAAVATAQAADELIDELTDRFGDPPSAVLGLIEVAQARKKAIELGVYEITEQHDRLLFYLVEVEFERLSTIAKNFGSRFMLNAGTKPYFTIDHRKDKNSLYTVSEILLSL